MVPRSGAMCCIVPCSASFHLKFKLNFHENDAMISPSLRSLVPSSRGGQSLYQKTESLVHYLDDFCGGEKPVEVLMPIRASQGLPQVWPAPQGHVVQYTAFLSLEGETHTTARTHIAAIGTFHKLQGWVDPSDCFLLRKLHVLQGFTRSVSQKDNRLPITFEKLQQLLS